MSCERKANAVKASQKSCFCKRRERFQSLYYETGLYYEDPGAFGAHLTLALIIPVCSRPPADDYFFICLKSVTYMAASWSGSSQALATADTVKLLREESVVGISLLGSRSSISRSISIATGEHTMVSDLYQDRCQVICQLPPLLRFLQASPGNDWAARKDFPLPAEGLFCLCWGLAAGKLFPEDTPESVKTGSAKLAAK